MGNEQRDNEDPKPPRARLNKAHPDLLHGFDEAPAGIQHVFRDAVERLEREKIDELPGLDSCGRIDDIRIHTQAARQYRNDKEKRRIAKAASRILDDCMIADTGSPEEKARWKEAIAALEKEDERVFVTVVTGAPIHLVYWDWKYAYSVPARSERRKTRRFLRDIKRGQVANAENARRRYGKKAQ